MARSAACLFAIALGALAGVAVVSLRGSSQRATELFTLNDFDTGRVSYPSQNLANGPPPLPASLGGSEHAHVMWAKKNGYRPFNGGQKLFSIHDFDSGRVSFPEEGLRGVHAVVKSTDTNIDPAGTGSDHIWQHQMSHGPVPGEQWPLEMPGFKARTMQLRVLTNDKSKVGKKQMALSSKLDKLQLQAALSLGKVGSELVAATQMLSSTRTHKRRVASTTAHKRHVGTLHSAAYKLSDKEERKLEDSIFDEPPQRTLHTAFKA